MSVALFRKGQKVKILPNQRWGRAYHNNTYKVVDSLNKSNYILQDVSGYEFIAWFEPEGQGTIWIKVGSTKTYQPSWL